MLTERKTQAISNLLFHCGNLRENDRALILCDPGTKNIADAFMRVVAEHAMLVTLLEIPVLQNHGAEPPEYVARKMASSTLIVSLCGYSLAHSNARIRAAQSGARFLSLPLYTWDLLEDPSLQINFKNHAPQVRKFANAFTKGKKITIKTAVGTDIEINITDRLGNYCPGFVENPGDLGSPPDIEANVSPIETASNGIVVIDGSITHPHFGLLKKPVRLLVENGKIVQFDGDDKNQIDRLNQLFGPNDSRRRVLAECGVGLNPAAKLTGIMLTDEGALGYLHFGFGANHTVGGKNEVDFHLDFVFRAATLSVDSAVLIKDGIPTI